MLSRRLAPRLALLLVLACPPIPAGATTYYVAPPPTGNDGNPGTLAAPWATLQHAADEIGPGDTVLVRAGSYAGGHFTTDGTAVAPIVLQAYPGETVHIVANNPTTPDGINLEGASHMTVEGFHVAGRTRAGIRAVLCEHVTIRGNVLDANGMWGILTGFCDDLRIEGNVASNSQIEHGIYVSNSGDRPVIRGNVVFGNFANGIHMNGDVSEGGDGVISDALVENNILWDNGDGDGTTNSGGGSAINCDGVQDSVIRNNLIFDTHASGISLYRIDGGGASTNNQVLHNTVLVANDGRWALNIVNASTGNTVRNNVFYSAQSFRGAMAVTADSLPGFSSDRNAVEDRFTTDGGNSVLTLAQWQAMHGQDATSFVVTGGGLEDLFVDPANGDYHPHPDGQLTDAGVTLATVPVDLEGTPRPQGPAYDIGSYEGTGVLFGDGFETEDFSRWSRSVP